MVKTVQDGCAEGLVYGGGGREGIFIKEVVPESPASKSLKLKEGDQILSATVYFDNMSYEDAVQILEHAQAYKVKLCLKRKPIAADADAESTFESDVIPEDDVYAPEMREQGKGKRRGEARISWPKFPSFGKGAKSRFTRSHSSSEVDEQRKLELSPTTSDTESPIKSQDALKGKKKHKMKLPGLTKRGLISSSEDQDTDAPTSTQMLSPECLESPLDETPQIYVAENLTIVEDLRCDPDPPEPQRVQHKVELISITSTLKTEDLTVALAGPEGSSGLKSPDGKKKKKKELSQLKIKILGKDKSPKKDAKAKQSPKRLKTLGASLEIADRPEKERSDIIPSFESQTELQGALDANTQRINMSVPKGELEGSDVALIQKSPQKGEEKTKKAKGTKQNQDSTFKLPKIGFSDISNEEVKQLATEGAEGKEDPYERLSKSGLSSTNLPKREDIEIPGMEDMSKRTTGKRIKEPKTVQLLIDVDSVKEAVSKLPGYKLPQVDTNVGGMVKDFEAEKQTFKLSKFETVTVNEELNIDVKELEMEDKGDMKAKGSELEVSGSKFKMPKLRISMPKVKGPEIDLSFSKKDVDVTLPEAKAEVKLPSVEFKQPSASLDIEAPEIEAEVDVDGSSSKFKMPSFKFPKFGVSTPSAIIEVHDKDVKIDGTDINIPKEVLAVNITAPSIDIEGPSIYHEGKGSKFKLPSLGFSGPEIKGLDIDLSFSKKDVDVTIPEAKAEVKLPSVEVKQPEVEVKIPEGNVELEGQESKFKMPKFGISMPKIKGPEIDLSSSKKDVDVTLPEAKAEVKLPDVKLKDTSAEIEIKGPEIKTGTKGTKGSPSKYKMPSFKFPKFGGGSPSATIEVPEKDIKIDGADIKIDGADIKIPKEVLTVDIAAPSIDIEGPSIDHEGKGSKFKLPSLSFSGTQIKGPDIDLSLSKKDVNVTLPEAKANVKLPDVKLKDSSAEVKIKGPGIDVQTRNVEGPSTTFRMPTFTLPKFGSATPKVSVDVPDVDEDIKVDVTAPSIETEGLSVDMMAKGSELEVSGSKFNMPKSGISMPKVKGPEIDLSFSKKDVDVTLPEAKAEVKLPSVEVKQPEVEVKLPEGVVELKVQESKFKMPKFGILMPKVKGPEIDLSLSKKDVDVTLPEAKAEVKLPNVKLKDTSAEIEMKGPEIKTGTKGTKGSPSKYKMPSFKFPKFGGGSPSATIEVLEKDIKIDGADIKIPKEVLTVDIAAPSIDIEGPSIDREGQESKFKLPSLGFSGPQIKGPDIDLSLSKKDVDVTLPEAKANVKLPDVKLKDTSAEMEIKGPRIDRTRNVEGSSTTFKMPTFTLPTFGSATPKVSVEVPDVDKHITVDVTSPSIETEGLSVEMMAKGSELEVSGSKFKMPKFGVSMPKVKGPEIDLSFSKKDIDVTLPETKAEVNLPSVEVKQPEVEVKLPEGSVELESQESKFKMPKFGISMPKVKGTEIDLTLSKKDVDVTLPEAKAEVKLPDVKLKDTHAEVEIKGPEIKTGTKGTKGSPSKYKMPSFKFPKFGSPSATIEEPEKDIKIDGADIKIDGADIKIPKEVLTIDIGTPSIDIKDPSNDREGKGSKFKLPSLGFSGPQIKGPDIDLSLSKKDVDVNLPEAKANVKLPDVKLKDSSAEVEIKGPGIDVQTRNVEGSSTTFKMPTFTLPKFGSHSAKVSVDVSDVDKDTKVDVTTPSIDTKGLAVEMKAKGSELEVSGSKFKMPTFGISMPKVEGPEIDLSFSKKDVNVTLPEAKAEVKLPDVKLKDTSATVDIKAPEIETQIENVEVSPSKIKKPRFSMPRFSFSKQSSKESRFDASLTDIDVSLPEGNVEVKQPEVEVKLPEGDVELEVQESKFKMPKLGISMPKVKGPEIDFSFSKKDVDVTLPEDKAEVKLLSIEIKQPSATVDIKDTEIEVQTKNVEGSPSKYIMPRFTLPKFESHTAEVSVDVPDVDEDITVKVTAPSIDTEGLSVEMKAKGSELEVSGSKFKMPKFGISLPKIKGPEIDLSFSKKDVDVTLPEAKAEVKLPSVEVKQPSATVDIKAPEIETQTENVEVSPSKIKNPMFSMPRFSFSKQSSKESGFDASLADIDVSLPEGNVEVKQPEVEVKLPEGDVELEVQESKFKMPKFGISMPKVKGPEIDLSFSKKDVDVTLPEAKAEVKLPSVEIKQPSAMVEIKASEIEAPTENVEGSPSKFKMPTFTLPKFGSATPKVRVEVPDVDKDIKVDVTTPSIDTEGLSVEMKAKGSELEVSGSKFKMPKFGISMPKVKGPEIDLSFSKKDVDVTLPEAKAEVKLPSVEIKQPSARVEIKASEIEAPTENVEGSPSKFKMPTFTLPKFGSATPKVRVEVPDVDKDIKVDVTTPSIDTEGLSVEMKAKGSELEVSGSKFKMPTFGISMPKVKGPEIDLSFSKKDVDVTLPEAKAEVKLPSVEVKQPSATVDIKAPEIETQTENVEVSPSKIKKPMFSMPRFSFSKQSSKESGFDASLADIDVSLPEGNVEVKQPEVEVKLPEGDVELEVQESKFKMPKFGISMPKVKGPEIDLSFSKKDVDVTLPEAKAEVKLPSVEIKQPSAMVEIKASEIEAPTENVEGSPSKFKMPTFTLPKFGSATPKVRVEVPDVDKDIKVDVTTPSIDTEGLSVEMKAKGSELEVSGSKFKMPTFGISMPKVKGPEIDLSFSKKDVEVTIPEAKAEVKLPEAVISASDVPTFDIETKTKEPNWTFPKPWTGGEAPDIDISLETAKADVISTEAIAKLHGPSAEILIEEPAEPDAHLKKTKFSLPRFSFSKSSVKEPEVSAELPRVDVSLPEGQVIVKQPELQIKVSEPEAELDGQGSKLKFPKFGMALPRANGPGGDLHVSQEDSGIEVKETSANVEMKASETQDKSEDVRGSPLKFKMPTLKMSKFGTAAYNVEAPDAEEIAERGGADLQEKVTVNIKGLTVGLKTEEPQAAITDSEMPNTGTEAVDLGSPSKFKLPLFKMPTLSFSRGNPEGEHVPVHTERTKAQREMKVELKDESKSPKGTFTSFAEILESIDVESDVPETPEHRDTLKEGPETDGPGAKQLGAGPKETKEEAVRSPERAGWFKFPTLGLSSPSEPAKDTQEGKSPVEETPDEETSPSCSVQSSDAFADVSSAMTSERGGASLASPTKVTIRYSGPDATAGPGEPLRNIYTTRTEMILVEPHLAEKITILSTSSSEDTLRLESRRIHVVTSNVRVIPEAQRAELREAVQVQSAGGLTGEPGAHEALSWTAEDSHGGDRKLFERRFVSQASSERSETNETIVITQQITRRFDSSEPVSDDAATSVRRLRDSVHSDKMRFFDGADE
ncbi:neuroblast differentiation-associated protein AHNAK-like [Pseudoliparis swirei]|uniref:neuroblast differentiation-associated protein AHNAK-like n=1 Tax=Pseudoliparis swirei TaxID=2059687 RepID=UPI0024BE3E45|nr:neuroblast differentiation-associated protein AHNAK-like [Pseudoliparis swirei]